MVNQPLLRVEHLRTHFYTSRGVVKALRGVSFEVMREEVLGIVGESGCGKSVTASSILRVLPSLTARIVAGKIIFAGQNLIELSEEEMRKIRGGRISIICQNPTSSLNPLLTIGSQLGEVLSGHRFKKENGKNSTAITKKILEILEDVQIPSPEMQISNYPFRLSGGMLQRIAIAMALLCTPEILIADEPTTALDVTIQAQILILLRELKKKYNTSIIFITHDLGVIARICDTVAVMYAGKIVEYNEVKELFRRPRHPYTRGLLRSIPILGGERRRLYSLGGQPPDLVSESEGCSFADRCEVRVGKCFKAYPDQFPVNGRFYYTCWNSQGD